MFDFRSYYFIPLFILLLAQSTRGAGNETINILPDSNKSDFRTKSRTFWQEELPAVLSRMPPLQGMQERGWIYSGGIHGTSDSTTSSTFGTEAFTTSGNRVRALKDGSGGTSTITYGSSVGCTGNDTAWVIISAISADTENNFVRSGISNYFVDCISSSQPTLPSDSAWMMKISIVSSAISVVEDLRNPIVCDGASIVSTNIQYLLDTVPPGSKVTLPPGTCLLNQPLTITRSLSLEGAGMNQTTLKQTVPTIPVLTVGASSVHVAGLTVSHSGTPIAGGDGLIVYNVGGLNAVTIEYVTASYNWRGFALGCVSYSQLSHAWAELNNSSGVDFVYQGSPDCGTLQWDVLDVISQLNLGAGFGGVNTAASNGIGPWITQSVSFGNALGGFSFSGTPGHPINDMRLTGLVSSADDRGGIYLDTYGGVHAIMNVFVELVGMGSGFPQGSALTPSIASNTGHGVAITSNNSFGVFLTEGTFWNNAWSGISIEAPNTHVIGGSSIGNGKALHADLNKRAGIHIGANNVLVSGHTFNYVGDGSTLHYIEMTGSLVFSDVGLNSYDPVLGQTAWINDSQVTSPIIASPIMAGGLTVHTNANKAGSFALSDVTGGATPAKFFRVRNGNLQILNAAFAGVLHQLSDQGTPSWPNRAGQVLMADTVNTATVTFGIAEPDTDYFVQANPVTANGGPAAGSLTIAGITKSTTGFIITSTVAPGEGKSVMFDWLVHR